MVAADGTEHRAGHGSSPLALGCAGAAALAGARARTRPVRLTGAGRAANGAGQTSESAPSACSSGTSSTAMRLAWATASLTRGLKKAATEPR